MTDSEKVRALYHQLIRYWNERDAIAWAALLAEDATIIGFDGSQMKGCKEAEQELTKIFANHPTASYVTIEKELRFLSEEIALFKAEVGMVPPGQNDIKPEVNAIQIMIAKREAGQWRIASFQNTPAAFHGRPELSQQLTAELREALHKSGK